MTMAMSGTLVITCSRNGSPNMPILINVTIYQVVWLLSVIGAAMQAPWLGPLMVVVAIKIHLQSARHPFEEIVLIAACALLGASFDSVLVALNWVDYPSGLFSNFLAPYWIITMWMLFATTLNVSLRWMRGRPLLAAVFGFFGGPLAYIAGNKLGAITLSNEFAALSALAIGWAIMMPALIWLSERLDGMPGPRRKWTLEAA